ncbi:MAG TPA: hypothetical protein VGK30_01860 [Candidatus Binatia bacterium]|jgi:hypothetical protein
MRLLLSLATVCLLVTPLYAGSPPSASKNPFGSEAAEQRQARKAEVRDLQEREERAHQVQEQREIEHPEMNYEEREEESDE